MSGLDRSDLKYLESLKTLAAEEARGFDTFHSAAERTEGAIPDKYRQLMALAVALTTQCPLCVENHAAKARDAGATRSEVAEAVFVAAAVRAGGAVGYGLLALRCYETATALT